MGPPEGLCDDHSLANCKPIPTKTWVLFKRLAVRYPEVTTISGNFKFAGSPERSQRLFRSIVGKAIPEVILEEIPELQASEFRFADVRG